MGWGSSMVSTVIAFALSAFFVAFIFIRLLCRCFRRAESPSAFELDLDPQIDVEQPRHRLPGLDPLLVAEIPTAKFSQDSFSTEDAQCSICLGEYEEKEVLRIMPKCGHNFHLVCIDIWLRKHSTCPICRLSLKDLIAGEGRDSIAINSSRPRQWHLLGIENSESSRSDNWDRPDSSSPRSPHEIVLAEPETGR